MLEQRYIDEIKLELEHIHTVIKEAVNILRASLKTIF